MAKNNFVKLLFLGLIYLSFFILFKSLEESLVIFCTTLFFDFLLLLWIFTRRPIFSMAVTLSALLFIYGSGMYKQQLLNTPLLVHDIYFFFQNIKENFMTFIQYPKILGSVIIAGIILMLFFIFIFKFEKPKNFGFLMSLMAFAFIAFSTRPMANEYKNEFKDMAVIDQIKFLAGDSDYLSKLISSLIILNTDVKIETHPVVRSFPLRAPRLDSSKADIISILHESTFNLKSVKDCPKDFCDLDVFEEDDFTNQSGFLKVHVMGGSTWLSEFAFLTGLDHQIFGDNGLYAPYTLAPHMRNSFVMNLKQQGYKTVAISSIEGDFLNAAEAFKFYGFDEFYDSKELGLNEDWLYVYDSDVYSKAIDYIKKSNPDQPLYIFIATIQNHGPHEDFLNNQTPEKSFTLDHPAKSNIEVYRQRYVESVKDIKNFESFLLGRKKKTVIVRFGDHQPSFDGNVESLDFNYPFPTTDKDKNYYTKYIIKSNFRPELKQKVSTQDISYLAGDTLYYAGVPMNDYFKANQYLKSHCKGKLMECSNSNLFKTYLGFIFGKLKIYE